MNWKQASRRLCEMHNRYGSGMAFLDEEKCVNPEDTLVNLTPDDKIHQVSGRELSPKDVRRYAWEEWRRDHSKLGRRKAVIWSVFQDGISYVAVGTMTKPGVAQRMHNKREHAHAH